MISFIYLFIHKKSYTKVKGKFLNISIPNIKIKFLNYPGFKKLYNNSKK